MASSPRSPPPAPTPEFEISRQSRLFAAEPARSTSGRMAEQPTSKDQHLYLVFDDWNSGYSIRKVSLPRRSGKLSDESGKEGSEQPTAVPGKGEEDSEQPTALPGKGAMPLPVFMRVPADRGCPEFFTSAFGTKIMALHPRSLDDNGVPTVDVLDLTCTSEVEQNHPAAPIYIPVNDDRLFALDIGSFEVLQKPERSGQLWEWQILTYPPFMIWDVSSYSVQPNGCILVSTIVGTKRTTFIFDTKESVWKVYGHWAFPFTGRGHYDPSLNGFVGLSKAQETLGYLYCCTMASTMVGDTGEVAKPDEKCTEHTVYSKNPAEGQHVSATLVHMRPGKFCLVECVCIDDKFRMPTEPDQMELMGGKPQGGHFMYRLKTFSLSKGDLKLKASKVRWYSLPHEARIGSIHQDPVAFWL